MSEEAEKLHATLDELKAELAAVEQDDPEVRRLLEAALADIQAKLSGDEPSEEPSLVERLSDAAQHYEESHPNLSGMLGGVIDALSRMGI
ncbi:MAG: DUF4404 family protein [Planctomycetota bacterium]|nr:MAG: DUF4404 family protein [Planctomycetota bacterium]REJ94137.1 MAG: DUF4404 family protein [Planctomycetota bacterium]REK26323.1 MAG: DUF4404 family protein [Planctomycetota bacterium]REK45874.1 MAG: DUF4404 family protein [Planctomycetota bacterium]